MVLFYSLLINDVGYVGYVGFISRCIGETVSPTEFNFISVGDIYFFYRQLALKPYIPYIPYIS